MTQLTSLHNLEVDWALMLNHVMLPGEFKSLETVQSFQISCLISASSSASVFTQKSDMSIAMWASECLERRCGSASLPDPPSAHLREQLEIVIPLNYVSKV